MHAPRPTCRFGEALPLFAEVFDVAPTGITTLSSRLKNFIRLGAAHKPGQGVATHFTADEVWQLLLLMALSDMGVTPQRGLAYWRDQPPAKGADQWIIKGRNGSTILVDLIVLRRFAAAWLPTLFAGVSEK